jgi:AAA15 family ATPase/GTPase
MLRKLELQNFKSHHCTQFNFDDSRLQAIVGQNSSGKTSVLQALSCLKYLSIVQGTRTSKDRETITTIGENNVTIEKDIICITARGTKAIENHEDWYFSCELGHRNDGWKINRTLNINGTEKNEDDFYPQPHIPQGGQPLLPDFEFLIYSKLLVDNLSRAAYSQEIVPEVQFDGSGLAPTLDYLRSEAPDRFQSIQEMLKQIVPGIRTVGIRRAKVKIDRQRSIAVDGKSIAYEESQEVTGQEIVLDYEYRRSHSRSCN